MKGSAKCQLFNTFQKNNLCDWPLHTKVSATRKSDRMQDISDLQKAEHPCPSCWLPFGANGIWTHSRKSSFQCDCCSFPWPVQGHLKILKLGRVKRRMTCQRRDLPNFHRFLFFEKQLLQLATWHEGLSNTQICQIARTLWPCLLRLVAHKLRTLSRKSSVQVDRIGTLLCLEIWRLLYWA